MAVSINMSLLIRYCPYFIKVVETERHFDIRYR